MRRLTALLLALTLILSLTACGTAQTGPAQKEAPPVTDAATEEKAPAAEAETDEKTDAETGEEAAGTEMTEETASSEQTEEPTVEEAPAQKEEEVLVPAGPYEIYDPKVMPEGGERGGVKYVKYNGIVEHLFFHPVIAYPEQAFDGDHMSDGYDDWMVTVGEYNAILQSVYERGYVLVDIEDCWSETVNADGQARMVKNTLYLPEGKKPLVISYDDVNYNYYTLGDGFTYKLIFGEDGKLWSWGLDPQGKEVVSRDLDAITILDKFVEQHPDFSPFGAKGCLSITGYEGILGYRTQTEKEGWTAEKEAVRQQEIEKVKPIVAELKRTGWTFGSHTFGHIRLDTRTLDAVSADMERWLDEVGSLVGETSVLFYPFGGRLDGDDVKQSGPAMQWMIDHGFRIFCSVGISSYTKIKKDACAVICDRLHPDGTTLRGTDKILQRYSQFYDARDIIDLETRPDRGVRWTPKGEAAKTETTESETPAETTQTAPETTAPAAPETPAETTEPTEAELLANAAVYTPAGNMTPDTVSAGTMGKLLCDETLADGKRIVCYWEPGSESVKYWAVHQGGTLLRFCREESGYDSGYSVRDFSAVLGQNGFCITAPRGAAYTACDYYVWGEDGVPRLLADCTHNVEEADFNGDGETDLRWYYHGDAEVYSYFRKDGQLYHASWMPQ